MCVCVCVCVCQRVPLSYPEISIISVQLSLKIDFFKSKQDKYVGNTRLFQYFWAWEGSLLSHFKILVSWESQVKYVRAKCQRAAQSSIKPREFLFHFVYWSYRLIWKKLLKVIWRKLSRSLFPDPPLITVFSKVNFS